MLNFLNSAAQAVAAIFGEKRDANDRKWTDRMTEARLDLVNEWAKGQDRDNSKVESLWRELSVIMDAAATETQNNAVAKT